MIKVLANELVDNLAPLQNGVSKSPTLRQSDCIIFQSGKAYTFSGDVFAIVSTPYWAYDGAVNYASLMEVLKKYKDSEVDIELQDSSTLVIKRGRSKTKLPFESTILLSISVVPTPDPLQWSELPPEFQSSVAIAESVAKVVHGDDILSSLNITPTCIEAASTSQIVRCKCELGIGHRFLIRAGLCEKLLKSCLSEFQLIGRWFLLRSSAVTFAIPVYLDEFIDDIDAFLKPAEFCIEFPSDLWPDLALIKTILSKDELMQVTLADGKCTIEADSSKGNHTAEAEMATPCDMSFKISPDLFSRLLTEFHECTISKCGIRVNNATFDYAASVEI